MGLCLSISQNLWLAAPTLLIRGEGEGEERETVARETKGLPFATFCLIDERCTEFVHNWRK